MSQVFNDLVSARPVPGPVRYVTVRDNTGGVDERGAAGALPGAAAGWRVPDLAPTPGGRRSRPQPWNDAPTKSRPALRANRCQFGCCDDEERVVSANRSTRRPPPDEPRRARCRRPWRCRNRVSGVAGRVAGMPHRVGDRALLEQA